ncbi:MAG: hypothetical protein ACYDA3_04370 [Gaiellaceae bacterium]
MKRWLLLLPLFLLGLFVAFQATAATRDTNVSSSIGPIGGGQYRWTVTQLSPDAPINSFTLVPGPGLTITSVVSVDSPGSCSVSGRNVVCNVPLTLAPCNCQAGGSAGIVLSGSGDVAGSVLQVNGAQFPVVAVAGPATTGATTTTAATTTAVTTTAATTAKPLPKKKKKVVPKCKKGHKSTRAHPCHK